MPIKSAPTIDIKLDKVALEDIPGIINSLVTQINNGFRRLTDVANANEASAIVATSLPPAGITYLGRQVLVHTGGADVLSVCEFNGAAYVWRVI